MVAKSEDALDSMNEICAYVGRSAPTVLDWIKNCNFPAQQTKKGGTWTSSKKAVDKWREWFATGEK